MSVYSTWSCGEDKGSASPEGLHGEGRPGWGVGVSRAQRESPRRLRVILPHPREGPRSEEAVPGRNPDDRSCESDRQRPSREPLRMTKSRRSAPQEQTGEVTTDSQPDAASPLLSTGPSERPRRAQPSASTHTAQSGALPEGAEPCPRGRSFARGARSFARGARSFARGGGALPEGAELCTRGRGPAQPREKCFKLWTAMEVTLLDSIRYDQKETKL